MGRQARIHDLLIFFATLGGIATFGVMGFLVGPSLTYSAAYKWIDSDP